MDSWNTVLLLVTVETDDCALIRLFSSLFYIHDVGKLPRLFDLFLSCTNFLCCSNMYYLKTKQKDFISLLLFFSWKNHHIYCMTLPAQRGNLSVILRLLITHTGISIVTFDFPWKKKILGIQFREFNANERSFQAHKFDNA